MGLIRPSRAYKAVLRVQEQADLRVLLDLVKASEANALKQGRAMNIKSSRRKTETRQRSCTKQSSNRTSKSKLNEHISLLNVIMEKGKRLLKRKQVISRNEPLVLPEIAGKQTVKEKPLEKLLLEESVD